MSALSVSAVDKSFGRTPVLRGLSLEVAQGSIAAVLGPSGCGKTTLLRVIAGFEAPDAGEIRIGGRVVAGPSRRLPPERRAIGFVPQEGALFPHLSVGGNVGYGLGRGAGGPKRVLEVLDLMGLAGLVERMPHELSGGQQQRVAVARAMAPRPALVLLDEPFSSLDSGLRREVREVVQTAMRADGATAVLVTHDQEEALSCTDLVAVMRQGGIVQAADPITIYRAPRDLEVAEFVGDAVRMAARFSGGFAETEVGRLPLRTPLPPDGAGLALIRPEQFVVTNRNGSSAPTTEYGPAVAATAGQQYFLGHDALLAISLSSGAVVTARSLDPGPVGERAVWLSVRGPVNGYAREGKTQRL
ncbi:MAG: ABC transporter ATP-binding protein [Geodermatophilaceae bacterium]|nr:ABC transporter ATP-binding protein [Geodermatophilaceae bacterium]